MDQQTAEKKSTVSFSTHFKLEISLIKIIKIKISIAESSRSRNTRKIKFETPSITLFTLEKTVLILKLINVAGIPINAKEDST